MQCEGSFNYISDGQFGAMMNVTIENDGPVTLELESPVKTT